MNSKKSGLRIAGSIFGLVAVVHLVRLVTGISVVIGHFLLPVWFNWMGFAAAGFLSFWLWKLSFNGK